MAHHDVKDYVIQEYVLADTLQITAHKRGVLMNQQHGEIKGYRELDQDEGDVCGWENAEQKNTVRVQKQLTDFGKPLIQELMTKLANKAKQPIAIELNNSGDIKTMRDGTRYRMLPTGWVKL